MSIEKKTAISFRAYKNAALFFLAVTSFVVTYPYGLKVVTPLLGSRAPLAAAFIAYLIFRIIDKPLSQALDYLEKTAGHGLTWNLFKWDNVQWKKAIVIALTVFTMAMTGSMSFISSYLISNTVAPPPDRGKLEENRQKNQDLYQGVLNELNADISKTEAAIPKAKRDGHRLVEAAIRSESASWQKNYRDGNSWFKKQRGGPRRYLARIAAAKADSAALVEARSTALLALQDQKTKHLAGAGQINTATDKAFFADWQRTETMFNSFWKFIFLMDIAAVIVVFILHWFLVMQYRTGHTLPESRTSFALAFSEWRSRIWDVFVDWLFRLKIFSIPETKTPNEPNEKRTSEASQPSPGYAPVRGAEHDEVPVGRVLRLVDAQAQQLQELSDKIAFLEKTSQDVRANVPERSDVEREVGRQVEHEVEQKAERKVERKPKVKPKPPRNKVRVPKWAGQAKMMRQSGMSFDAIAKKLKKSKSTVHRWAK